MRTLKEIESGNTVKVIKLDGKGPVKRRIMDMGLPEVQLSLHKYLHLL